MKAILREWGDDVYVAKDVDFSTTGNFTCEGKAVSEANILTVVEDNKSKPKYVQCSSCGELIPNNAKAIEEHRTAHNTFSGCYGCDQLRSSVVVNKNNKTKYELNDDGTFTRKINDNVNLYCGRVYSKIDITSDNRKEYCKYKGCANAEIKAQQHFFSKYPNAFDEMITVDALKNFKEIYAYRSNQTRLKLKCRGNIYAYANSKGIIESFQFECRYDTYNVFYSKKYDKFFYRSGSSYREFARPYNMTTDRFNYIKETIAKLYN